MAVVLFHQCFRKKLTYATSCLLPLAHGKMGSALEGKEQMFCFNLLNISRQFHCYMLDESFCHFRGVGSI